jgi:hypothetical protein
MQAYRLLWVDIVESIFDVAQDLDRSVPSRFEFLMLIRLMLLAINKGTSYLTRMSRRDMGLENIAESIQDFNFPFLN